MKKYLWTFAILTISTLADSSPNVKPVYRYAFYTLSTSAESLELLQHIKAQVIATNRGDAILQTNWTLPYELTSKENGEMNLNELKKLHPLENPEKIIISQSNNGVTQLQMVDIESSKIEYKNSLPDSVSKSLLQDFYAYLDKKNIYLAISERKSSPSAPIKFSQLKAKYVAGEPIRFELEATGDSYVYVVFIPESKSAEPLLLFPNPNQSVNYLKKGERIMIPENNLLLKASPPYGHDKIKVFASKEEWTDFQFKNQKGESFFKLLPPALTGTKSVSLPDLMARTILNTQVTEWDLEISPN
ncbi:DUF4384 domain-containing protein [Leptospira ognonensis]|uniref:DUF4384 domain-containing protein n=1 Tax=Leptospira ognonensis TaxID=2484945 RepID=A0A4R9K751_9LEPT|nr:DUF4384 domain-containing protein [Leptospira ognonensis]TGL61200.1 DUF4384 domain-containing protein [Leptospira ognonensis]